MIPVYSEEIQRLLDSHGIKIGDLVRLKIGDAELDGELMPKANIGSSGTIIIKMADGYNIGMKLVKELEIKKLSGGVANIASFPKISLKHDGSAPKVGLIYTGGTIGSRVDYETGGVSMLLKPEELLYKVPEIQGIANISVDMLMSVASEDLSYHEWGRIAESVAKAFNNSSRGAIITIGTDAMHYTAAALSFMLQGLNGPVVLTGAQRSSDRGSSDGFINLICATQLASKSDIAEVGICMHNESSDGKCAYIRGVKARKMHTSRRDAFRAINDKPMAYVSIVGDIKYHGDYRKIDAQKSGNVSVMPNFDPRVAIVKIYPNSNPKVIDFYVNEGYRGIILEGTGLGHAPVSTNHQEFLWLPHIKYAIDNGLIVGMTSQCLYGRVHPNVYKNLRLLSNIGVIYCEDMMAEVAQIKLGWLLGNYKRDEAMAMLNKNLVGEIQSRLEFDEFLV
jgi:glutamyl-tRNA(Gln) amidotransferase subunit D